MKTEVYSWRVSSELKSELERQARLRKVSISAMLDLAARDWLKNTAMDPPDAAEQRRLQRAAANSFGVLAGNNPRRAETARESVRQRLDRRYAR